MSSLLCCIPRETPELEVDIDCKITCCTEQTLERRRSMKKDGVDGNKEVRKDIQAESVGCCCCRRRIKRQAKIRKKDESNNE